jgi:hypothetical protein
VIYTHAAAAVIALAVGFAGAWKVQDWRIEAMQAEQARLALKAIEAAQAETTKLQEVKDEALRRANQRASQNQLAADGARSELDRLRDTIAASDSAQPSCPARVDTAPAARALLAECAARYQDLARKADGHASDAMTLQQAWPK